jgi:5'-nucleotidase
MRILLTNDDGIHAPGLIVLEAIARKISDDIVIVAPSEEQSGTGHSLTLTRPVRMRKIEENRFSVAGTPTDSVMMALNVVMKDNPPDLILSGVNRGANLGEDVTYSGTVSAALEGALANVRSIALSQVYSGEGRGDYAPWEVAESWGDRAVRPLLDMPWAPRTLVNINFPAVTPDAVKGIKVVSQGLRDYGRSKVVKRTDPRGFDYYWFALEHVVHTAAHSTDLEAIEDGYVTVTPMHVDMTHGPGLATLAARYA